MLAITVNYSVSSQSLIIIIIILRLTVGLALGGWYLTVSGEEQSLCCRAPNRKVTFSEAVPILSEG